MKKNNNQYWVFQLVGWLGYAFLLLVALYLKDELTNKRIIFVIISASIGLLISHSIRYIFLRFHFFNYSIIALIPRVLVLTLSGAIIFEIFYSFLSSWIDNTVFPRSIADFLTDTISLFSVLLIWSIIYFTNHFIRKSRLEEIKNLQLVSANTEIELQHLRTQLNPHFLFNALNSIRALINIDPTLAKESITKLSSILRNSLLFGRKSGVSVEEECQFVNDYLSLEKIRFEERISVNWDIDSNSKTILIPPLIIQTQVENAIKHGISNRIKGGVITIRVKLLENVLTIEIRNSGKIQKKENKKSVGVGLTNTQRRLELTYGNKAKHSLFEENGEVVSQIKIELT